MLCKLVKSKYIDLNSAFPNNLMQQPFPISAFMRLHCIGELTHGVSEGEVQRPPVSEQQERERGEHRDPREIIIQ